MLFQAVTTAAAAIAATTVLSGVSALPAGQAPSHHTHLLPKTITPKVMLITQFDSEQAIWQDNLDLPHNISFVGASPLFPNVTCDDAFEICHVTTGEGQVNSASTIMSLTLSPKFDLTTTYFLIGGIAGISPHCGTLGSVNFARYSIQADLSHEIDARQMPENFTTGYFLQGSSGPGQLPAYLYGTEIFEVNTNLIDKMLEVTKDVVLNDSTDAAAYRALYGYAPVSEPPSIIQGVVTTQDVWFFGSLLDEAFENVTRLYTGGGAADSLYCMTAQEDTGTLESLIRATRAGLADFSRIILMRTGSNLDRAPPGTDEYTSFMASQGGFSVALQNIYNAGKPVIDSILQEWDDLYLEGIEPQANFTTKADDLHSLDIPETYTN